MFAVTPTGVSSSITAMRNTTPLDPTALCFGLLPGVYFQLFMVDSHLHVWGNGKTPFPYADGQEPPDRLRESSDPETLLEEMDKAGVGGALIVQVGIYWLRRPYFTTECISGSVTGYRSDSAVVGVRPRPLFIQQTDKQRWITSMYAYHTH